MKYTRCPLCGRSVVLAATDSGDKIMLDRKPRVFAFTGRTMANHRAEVVEASEEDGMVEHSPLCATRGAKQGEVGAAIIGAIERKGES
jgi:hypothetical protein